MELQTHLVPGWPPLAWLARLPRDGSGAINVLHGRGVETRPNWFCEAVWDGPFSDGRFDATDIVMGSGARLSDGRVVFVGAGTSIERLHVLPTDACIFVSNSLCCLLAASDAHIAPHYPHYQRDLRSIVKGVRNYSRFLRSSRGPVELVYFDNLSWDGTTLKRVTKPMPARTFDSFQGYKGFLLDSMSAVISNANDPNRSFRYEPFGTLSGGYDSPTVMALAREHGCDRALYFDRPTANADSIAPDIAKSLGIELVTVGLSEWRNRDLPEVEFIVGIADAEDIRFAGASEHLANTLVFTGTRGDLVWGLRKLGTGPEFSRMDTQGISLGEARLWHGYQHCAPAFWSSYDPTAIWSVTHSAEMQPWDIGGDYNRPICRRILEEAGLARGSFATSKQGQSPSLQNRRDCLTDRSWQAYSEWVSDHRDCWLRAWRLPPNTNRERDIRALDRQSTMRDLLSSAPVLWRMSSRPTMPTRARRFVFPWAVDVLKKRYRIALDERERHGCA